MPLTPEESQIHERAQGPRTSPATGRTAQTPRPVPGPRPLPGPRSAATPRPGRPGPGPARPAPPAQRSHNPSGPSQPPRPDVSVPRIELIGATPEGAVEAADEAVDLQLDSGRAPGDILVLTVGEQHPWAAHELSFGETAYWAQHEAGDDVFFADATAVDRARARPVVIVAVNGGTDADVARVLQSALQRAGALLVVCGDPERATTALGPAAHS